jgi:hypothetical protein
MITDVGIDMDGVMYDFVGVFQEFCENRMGRKLTPATKWDFYHDWDMTDLTFQMWLNDATEDMQIFNWYEPMKNTAEGWASLREQGITIHILTHRHANAYQQTARWLQRYDLLPDGLHFGRDKTILKVLSNGKCAAIDDHVPYHNEYEKANIMSFLRTQPWNLTSDAHRVEDLLDFATKVKLYNEYHAYFKGPKLISKVPMFTPKNQFIKNVTTSNPHSNDYTQTYKWL